MRVAKIGQAARMLNDKWFCFGSDLSPKDHALAMANHPHLGGPGYYLVDDGNDGPLQLFHITVKTTAEQCK